MYDPTDPSQDPLADYTPDGEHAAAFGHDPDALAEGAPCYSPVPGHLIAEPDQMLAQPDYPEPPADLDERDYREHEVFPVEEHGSYAEHYPEDAARQSRIRHGYDQAHTSNLEQGLTGTQERIVETMRNCLASTQDRTGGELMELLRYIGASTLVMDKLEPDTRSTYTRITEILVSEYCDDTTRQVDLSDIAGLDAASSAVRAELNLIEMRCGREDLPRTPTAAWKGLVNLIQRDASRTSAMALAAALAAGETDEECMKRFRELQAPTSSGTLRNSDFSRTAREWQAADKAAEAESPGFRISSGYPTLDYAFTAKDGQGRDIEPRGAWGPGELHIFAAPTGNGKSAAARRLITSAAEDLVNGWGREHDKVLIAITEEAPKIVYTVAGMAEGDRFHHLAGNLVIANVGASRRRFIHAIWDCVVDAFHRSQETGMPVTASGLPSFVVLDYVGGLVEDGESADTTAIEKTANLLLRGIAAWDVMMMEEFSGESFAAYAGMSWPRGMENYKPAVLGFAQFKKLADPQWFDPSKKSSSLEDFMIPNHNGEPGWEVLAGDFRLPTQGEVRGSGVLINHATSLIIGHRSRPQKNPKVVDPVTGRVRLVDSRARWLLVKTRNGSDLPFIEMRFDSLPSGLRGQFFDYRAEVAHERGKLAVTECYREQGDPMLPARPAASPFDGVSY